MKRTFAIVLGAAAVLALSGAAQASTITLGTGKEVLQGWTGNSPDYAHSLDLGNNTDLTKHTVNLHASHSISATLSGKASGQLGYGSSISNGSLDLNSGLGKGTATATFDFSLAQPAHYFGFEWNDASSGDTVTFYGVDDKTILAVVDGTDLMGKSKDGSYYANFTSNLPIGKIVLSATGSGLGNKFEVNCVTVSAVPVPAALPLFGAAVAGLGAMGKRRRRKAAAAGVTLEG